MDNENRKEQYDALYKDYFQASLFGLVALIIYKAILAHFYSAHADGSIETNAFNNVIENYRFYLLISLFMVAMPVVLCLISISSLNKYKEHPWFLYYSKRKNKIYRLSNFITKNGSVISNVLYGLSFCFLSDAVESTKWIPSILCVMFSWLAMLVLLVRSINARRFLVPFASALEK